MLSRHARIARAAAAEEIRTGAAKRHCPLHFMRQFFLPTRVNAMRDIAEQKAFIADKGGARIDAPKRIDMNARAAHCMTVGESAVRALGKA